MKYLLFLTILFYNVKLLTAQCKPVFRTMQSQPPVAPDKYWNFEQYNYFCSDYYSIFTLDTLSGSSDTQRITYHYWNDTSWTSLPMVLLTGNGSSNGFLHWNNRFFIYGYFSGFNNNRAPAGRHYDILECKNGIWDSLPGALLNDSNNYSVYSYCSNNYGLYRLYREKKTDSLSNHFFIGGVERYDTASNGFVKILDFENNKDTEPYLISGINRLLIAGVSKLNGNATKSFGYIDSITIYTNTDNRFYEDMLYNVDGKNDHIFATSRSSEPVIYEYSNQLIGSRQTNEIGYSDYGTYGAFDGKIVMVTFDMSGNKHMNVLCSNETNWKTIVLTGDYNGWGNVINTNTGFYIYDNYKFRTLKLGTGSLIEGIAFLDLDSNCVLDTSNDYRIKGQLITASAGSYTATAITDQEGKYELYVIRDTFTLSGPSPITCMKDTVFILRDDTTISRNLPMLRPGFYDIKVRFLDGYRVRWNDTTQYNALIENLGEPSDSAYFEFKMDNKIDILGGDNAVKYISGNIAGGQLKDLGYYDKRIVTITAWVDSAANKPDSIVCNSFMAYLYTSEIDSMNNADTICQKVVYSLDPNHKTCNKETIPVNLTSGLEYTIEFQNEGNDNANEVVIIDTLSSALSIETFKIIGSSHHFTTCLENNVLTVNFKDIHLKPKATDENFSKGTFKYSIATKTGLKNNASINNIAYIYFDLNPPVITNNAIVRVSDGSAASLVKNKIIKQEALTAFPNPARGELTVLSRVNEAIHIFNMEGREVFGIMPENGVATVDITSWASGIYMIRCGNAFCKVIKMGE